MANDAELQFDSATAEVVVRCPFCAIASGRLAPELLAHRDEQTAAFPALHQQPRNRGHMLVVPVAHIAQIYELQGALNGALMAALVRVARAVKQAFAADGVSIRQNNDAPGGQSVFHVHFHVIPRFAGDGFDDGDDRFPLGALQAPHDQRVTQAAAVREALRRRE